MSTDFFRTFPTQEFAAGRKMIVAGQRIPHVYYLVSGTVKMSTTSEDGRSLTLHVFQPDSFFSLIDLISQEPNRYDFEAITPVVAKIVPRADVEHFLKTNPEASYLALTRAAHGLRRLCNRIEEAAFGQAENQVASLLLYFARHYGEITGSKNVVRMKITHQDIAEWLGLSRENVSLQMKKLERLKLIAREKSQIVITDVDGVKKLASQNLSLFE